VLVETEEEEVLVEKLEVAVVLCEAEDEVDDDVVVVA